MWICVYVCLYVYALRVCVCLHMSIPACVKFSCAWVLDYDAWSCIRFVLSHAHLLVSRICSHTHTYAQEHAHKRSNVIWYLYVSVFVGCNRNWIELCTHQVRDGRARQCPKCIPLISPTWSVFRFSHSVALASQRYRNSLNRLLWLPLKSMLQIILKKIAYTITLLLALLSA